VHVRAGNGIGLRVGGQPSDAQSLWGRAERGRSDSDAGPLAAVAYGHCGPGIRRGRRPVSHSYPYVYADADAYPHRNGNAYGHTNRSAAAYPHHRDAYPYADAHAYCDANAHGHCNAYPAANLGATHPVRLEPD